MPGLLYHLSWISTVVHICLGTLALAAALYYLAELVEEYTSTAAKVLRYWIWVTIGLYILLFLFESLPTSVILCGLISQLVHLSILRTFPFFFLTSLPFILGVVLFFVNHYLAFSFFASYYYPASEVNEYHPKHQINSKRSSTGTSVNRDDTSKQTSLKSKLTLISLSLLTKSILFMILEFDILPTNGLNKDSNQFDNLYVMDPSELTIGRAGKFGLCVLISPYIYGSEEDKDDKLFIRKPLPFYNYFISLLK
ncbi:uncharacterized protein [Panulirus ornatus]|uniref:uncharacterized protein isoform X2 n=1 Tax=Panulirus ornatus TaxID=150431 RepID=UPI003A869DD6